MSEQEKHTTQKQYECVNPGSRFVTIAEHILERLGGQNGEHRVTAHWSGNNGADEYYLHRYDNRNEIHTTYWLSHLDKRMMFDNQTRYAVIVAGNRQSLVLSLDENDQSRELNSKERGRVTQQALEILSQKAPEVAREAMMYAFERQFNRAAATYVLSNFADEDDKVFNDATVRTAVEDHNDRTMTVIREEIQEAIESQEHLQARPAEEKVLNGAMRPSPGGKNRFMRVPLLAAALEVAREMEYKWPYEVSLSTDHFENERYMEKGGNHE